MLTLIIYDFQGAKLLLRILTTWPQLCSPGKVGLGYSDVFGLRFKKLGSILVLHKGLLRRKIRLMEGNAKCRHLKKLTCNGTLLQVFVRVYRLEIANFLRTFSHVGMFNQALGSVLFYIAPRPFSLV